jgi:hypothetical protein
VEQWRVRRISAQGSRRHCHLNQALRALSDVAKRVAVVLVFCLFTDLSLAFSRFSLDVDDFIVDDRLSKACSDIAMVWASTVGCVLT